MKSINVITAEYTLTGENVYSFLKSEVEGCLTINI